MTIADTVRQAKLKPERAAGYPTLPAGRWTTATGMAALVALDSPAKTGSVKEQYRLSDGDFEFRGGSAPDPVGVRATERARQRSAAATPSRG